MSMTQLQNIIWHNEELGYQIKSVKDATGKDLPVAINKTMMRIDLPQPLASGEKFEFAIDWEFNIHDRAGFIGGRPGYEYFAEDGNYLYTMAEWFPRMAVYSDFEGWQNLQFIGRGEFALVFGDYEVEITVPADHMVASTGELQKLLKEVLSATEFDRWTKAQNTFDKPVIIRTQAEAEN